MHPIVEQHRHAVAELCKRHRVARLDLFGSAAEGEFDEAHSDFDFIVEFAADLPPGQRFDAYFGLREDLEGLFGRTIDLVEPGGLRNPYFIRSANQTRKQVYAA